MLEAQENIKKVLKRRQRSKPKRSQKSVSKNEIAE